MMDGPSWFSHGIGFVVTLFVLAILLVFLGWVIKECADYCWYGEWFHDHKIRSAHPMNKEY